MHHHAIIGLHGAECGHCYRNIFAHHRQNNNRCGFIFAVLAALLFALSEGQTLGWTAPVILGSLILALLALGCFVWCELKVPDPLLELRLFKRRNFLLTNLLLSLVLALSK